MIIDATDPNRWTYIVPLNPEDWPENPQRLGLSASAAPSAADSSPADTRPGTAAKSAKQQQPTAEEATPTPAPSAQSVRPN